MTILYCVTIQNKGVDFLKTLYMEDRLLSVLAAHITVAISVYTLIFCQAENFYNNLLLLFLYKYCLPD